MVNVTPLSIFMVAFATYSALSLFAVNVDPMTFAAAAVMIISGIGAVIVSVINAFFAARDRSDAKVERQLILQRSETAATNSEDVAKRAVELHSKVESIKQTTEKAAKDVDGNLTAVREELHKALELNQALNQTVATLTEIVKTQRSQSRSTDAKRSDDVVEPKSETK
jgi:hypothetical protein